jgi:phospholipid transport system substrate-binding protein
VAAPRFLDAIFVALVGTFATVAHASANPPRRGRLDPSGVAAGAPADPLNALRRTDLALESVLRRRVPDWSPEAEARKGRVDGILADALDYGEIARRALGTDWNKLTTAEQQAFVTAFSALTNQAFVAALTRPDVHLRFDSETVIGPVASVVVTAWASKRVPETVQRIDYRMARRGDRWLITDVLVDGVSLADGYHDQFARLMRRGGFAEVMGRMRHKLEVSGGY